MNSKAILIVLDGFGIGKDSPFNAIANAKKPFLQNLFKKYPSSQLLTHGLSVGLPEGVMGNSEVGHMTMGAGRIIYQDLTRISKEIREGVFFKNPELVRFFQSSPRLHFMGLLSDGGVHSHIEHLEALLSEALRRRIPEVLLHLFLDGRDTQPKSSLEYVQRILNHPIFSSTETRASIVSLSGRYYAMDRDQRWERVEKAYRAMTGLLPVENKTPLEVIQSSHTQEVTDEFLEPVFFGNAILSGDSVLFFNFRSDRAREISQTFFDPEFSKFKIDNRPQLQSFTSMTQYDVKFNPFVPYLYGPQNLDHILGNVLEAKALKQLRIAETEKYAHVTFFFNAGREAPFMGEDRTLIPSARDVATYDLKPEMSAPEIARAAAEKIESQQYDFILMNFANADMVGHTGNYAAAVQAIEALDTCLEKVIGAAQRSGYHVLMTADHGNAESMQDHDHQPHTQHTLNPVPSIWVAPDSAIAPKIYRTPLLDGGLADLMPTICELMNLPIPAEVTGKSLLPRNWSA